MKATLIYGAHDVRVEEVNRMGHEFAGIIEDVGAQVGSVKKGDLVVAPFLW